jgi:hypothetical protein
MQHIASSHRAKGSQMDAVSRALAVTGQHGCCQAFANVRKGWRGRDGIEEESTSARCYQGPTEGSYSVVEIYISVSEKQENTSITLLH